MNFNRRSFIAAIAALPVLGKVKPLVGDPKPPSKWSTSYWQDKKTKVTIFYDDPGKLPWGTYGPNHCHDLKWVTLGDCTTEHLHNILRDDMRYRNLSQQYRDAINLIIKSRVSVV